jgi:hypothetical protein
VSTLKKIVAGPIPFTDEYLADDNANRSQSVLLDKRRFGSNSAALKQTKTVGW